MNAIEKLNFVEHIFKEIKKKFAIVVIDNNDIESTTKSNEKIIDAKNTINSSNNKKTL